jgi:flagellar assembly factor FliW
VTDPEKQDGGKSVVPSASAAVEEEFFFPEGLLSFSSHRHFVLSPYQPADGSPSPFFLLQAKEDDLSFPLISPNLLATDYRLSLAPELLAKLAAGSMADLVVFAIVTVRDQLEQITVNLQGPILLNPVSHLGFQLVAEQYPLRYPLINPQEP